MVVLDSSALIAFFKDEPGATVVERHLPDAAISSVNVEEIAKKMADAGGTEPEIRAAIERLGLDIWPHELDDAFRAAALAPATKKLGSGLGDRSCMALAMRLGVPALTTDKAWAKLDIPGLQVVLIR